MGIVREFIKLLDYIRREILQKFNSHYLEDKLKKRRGKCKQCGRCCKGCPELNNKTHKCMVYKNRNPMMCHKDFPLDKFDQKLFGVDKTCGYWFEK